MSGLTVGRILLVGRLSSIYLVLFIGHAAAHTDRSSAHCKFTRTRINGVCARRLVRLRSLRFNFHFIRWCRCQLRTCNVYKYGLAFDNATNE